MYLTPLNGLYGSLGTDTLGTRVPDWLKLGTWNSTKTLSPPPSAASLLLPVLNTTSPERLGVVLCRWPIFHTTCLRIESYAHVPCEQLLMLTVSVCGGIGMVTVSLCTLASSSLRPMPPWRMPHITLMRPPLLWKLTWGLT